MAVELHARQGKMGGGREIPGAGWGKKMVCNRGGVMGVREGGAVRAGWG